VNPQPHSRPGHRQGSGRTDVGAARATLAVEHCDGVVVLHIGGDLDMVTVPDLQASLAEATEPIDATRDAVAPAPVVVDLSDVRLLSVLGLRMLVALHTDLAAGDRPLRLVTGRRRLIVRLLQIAGLDQLYDLYPDLLAALAATPAPGRRCTERCHEDDDLR
jgi:anti-sigma B factor antagonist